MLKPDDIGVVQLTDEVDFAAELGHRFRILNSAISIPGKKRTKKEGYVLILECKCFGIATMRNFVALWEHTEAVSFILGGGV